MKLVAADFKWFPDSRLYSRHQFDNVCWPADRRLYDRKFVAPQSGDDIGCSKTGAQAVGHDFQEFITNRMSERIIHRFELIDVDVKYRDVPTALDLFERLFEMFPEKYPIGQIS
jgi:hypothetical protein